MREVLFFIDEIQRKENAGLFLKGIYDLGLPYKFIISGSVAWN
jgi:predicted AAA+ superfamily ATPase